MDTPTTTSIANKSWEMLKGVLNKIKGSRPAVDSDDDSEIFASDRMRPWKPAHLSQPRKPRIQDDQTQDVVFIRDIAQSSDDAWKTGDDCFWPEQLENSFRIFTFDYDSSYANSMNRIIAYDALKVHALRLLRALRKWQKDHGHFFAPLIVAHGYGGLICEQAYYLLSLQEHRRQLIRIEGLILFGTPHFRAGLAQWLLISAKQLRIPCEDTPQKQNWSPFKKDLDGIAEMQREFRALDPGPRIACFFATSSTPKTKLKISPEWAVLPGVKSVPLDSHHFSMTKPENVNAPGVLQTIELLNKKLSPRLNEETLLQYWIQSSKIPIEAWKGSDVKLTTKIPSDERADIPNSEPRESEACSTRQEEVTRNEHQHSEHSEQAREQHYRRLRKSKSPWDKALARREPLREDFLEVIAREDVYGIDIFDCLFALRAHEITISERLLLNVARNSTDGADILDLFFTMKAGEFVITEEVIAAAASNAKCGEAVMKLLIDSLRDIILTEVIKGAAANEECGKAILELLFERCSSHIKLTEEIVKAAAANAGVGKEVMELLLGCENQIVITEDVLKAAIASSGDGYAVMRLLVERCEKKLPVTEGIIMAAAKLPENARERMMCLLLQVLKNRRPDSTSLIGLLLDSENHGHSLLSWAADNDEDTFRLLLEIDQIDLDSEGSDGYTPLSRAAANGQHNIVKLLMDSKMVNIDLEDSRGRTPLSIALATGKAKAVALLGKAAKNAKTELNKPGLGSSPDSLLLRAVFDKDDDMVRALRDTGNVDMESRNRTGQTALSWAAEGGQKEIVKILLELDEINVNTQDDYKRTPLVWAVEGEYEKIVQLLLDGRDIDVNLQGDKGETPLSCAAGRGRKDIVEMLLDASEIDVNTQDAHGWTPLLWAAKGGFDEIVQLLVDRREIDVNLKGDKGETPLSQAEASGHDAVVRVLHGSGKLAQRGEQ